MTDPSLSVSDSIVYLRRLGSLIWIADGNRAMDKGMGVRPSIQRRLGNFSFCFEVLWELLTCC